MAVTFDANASSDATQNGVTSITTSNLTIGSGSNRALVVQVVWSGSVTSAALNWDQLGTPQALTAIAGTLATNTAVVQLWGLVAPTSGAKQLKASWTTAQDVIVNGVSWTGVDQTGGSTSFPHGTNGTTSGNPATVTVTSATNNAVMAVHATATSSFTSVNNTQTFLDNTPATVSGAGNRAAGAATVTLTGTMGAVNEYASAGCDILAGGAAAAQVPYNTYYQPIVTQ